jgi:lambda repressor-like predicted transcriptional regulator
MKLKNKINREYNKKQKIVIKRIGIKYGVKIK